MTRLVSAADFQADLEIYLDEVEAKGSQIVVTRENGKPLILARLADWEGMEETLYLLGTPSNAQALRESIAQLEAGQGLERDLIDR